MSKEIEEQIEREQGQYWIKLFGEDHFIIATWSYMIWTIDGDYCPPRAILEIDERRIVREE